VTKARLEVQRRRAVTK